MSNREAPPRIVPRVFAEDGGGYARPAKCFHCGQQITKDTLAWGRLVSDPSSIRRAVHALCLREYQMFVLAFWSDRGDVTPTF